MANLEYSLVQPFMIYAEFTPSAVPLLRFATGYKGIAFPGVFRCFITTSFSHRS